MTAGNIDVRQWLFSSGAFPDEAIRTTFLIVAQHALVPRPPGRLTRAPAQGLLPANCLSGLQRDLIHRVLAARPTLSNRKLTWLVGMSDPTVAAVRARQRSTAKASQLNTKGADTPRDIVAHDDRS